MGLFGDKKGKKTAAANLSKKSVPVHVSDFVLESGVSFFPAGQSKEQIFKQLIDRLSLPDAAQAFQQVMEREAVGATVIAPGLAIPHARVGGVDKVLTAVGICSSGVPQTDQERPVQIFFLFVSPKEKMHDHLMFLAGVSALFQIEGLIDQLAQQTEAPAVLRLIREAEAVRTPSK